MLRELKPEELRALAKCRVAECFEENGPELTSALSHAAFGAVRRSVYITLKERGLVEFRIGRVRLSEAGLVVLTEALEATP